MQGLFQAIFYTEKVNSFFTDEASIAYMLQFESALATAQARHGVIPQHAAEIIADSCNVEGINITQLITDAGLGGNANIPLVKQLTGVVRQKDIAA
jgi:3-carboxy-cis,cis-muconate cycloisomerase